MADAKPSGGAPEVTAREVIEHIIADNPVFRWLGCELIEVERGYTLIAMVVRKDMTNIHGTLHGGLMFTLADIAFGYAAQSYNEKAVSASASMEFIAPGRLGERLIAEAREAHKEGRNAIIDVSVRNEAGTVLALVRGRMRYIGGVHIG